MYCVDMRGIGWLNLHGVNIYKPFRIRPSVCLEVPVRIGTENKQEVFVMKNVLQDGFHGFCMARTLDWYNPFMDFGGHITFVQQILYAVPVLLLFTARRI